MRLKSRSFPVYSLLLLVISVPEIENVPVTTPQQPLVDITNELSPLVSGGGHQSVSSYPLKLSSSTSPPRTNLASSDKVSDPLVVNDVSKKYNVNSFSSVPLVVNDVSKKLNESSSSVPPLTSNQQQLTGTFSRNKSPNVGSDVVDPNGSRRSNKFISPPGPVNLAVKKPFSIQNSQIKVDKTVYPASNEAQQTEVDSTEDIVTAVKKEESPSQVKNTQSSKEKDANGDTPSTPSITLPIESTKVGKSTNSDVNTNDISVNGREGTQNSSPSKPEGIDPSRNMNKDIPNTSQVKNPMTNSNSGLNHPQINSLNLINNPHNTASSSINNIPNNKVPPSTNNLSNNMAGGSSTQNSEASKSVTKSSAPTSNPGQTNNDASLVTSNQQQLLSSSVKVPTKTGSSSPTKGGNDGDLLQKEDGGEDYNNPNSKENPGVDLPDDNKEGLEVIDEPKGSFKGEPSNSDTTKGQVTSSRGKDFFSGPPANSFGAEVSRGEATTALEEEDVGVFSYLLTFVVICGVCLFMLHHRKRIFAIVLEGRRPRGGRTRRSSTGSYRKLENNFD